MMSISGFTPVNQVRLTNVAYVRLNKSGQRFEIACYRNKVVNWRNKIETDLNEVLQIPNIFSNVGQGMLASKAVLMEAFGTTDEKIICAEILEKGDLQVTELERQALIEGMFRDVATIVSEKSVNPETDRPYTISMIQNAMKDIHYSVNLTKNAKQQALDVIRKLRKVMPIARVMMSLKISLAVPCCDQMREFLSQKSANILKDTTLDSSQDPSLANTSMGTFEVTIDPEHYRAIQEQLNLITNGNGLLEILHQSSLTATTSQQSKATKDEEEETAMTAVAPAEEEEETNPVKLSSSAVSNREKSSKKKERGALLPELEGAVEGIDEGEVIGIASKSKGKNKKKAKQQRQQLVDPTPERDSDDEENDESSFPLPPSSPSSSAPAPADLPSSKKDKQQNKNKVGKKSKRIEKEKQKEIEGREKEREVKLHQLHEAAAHATVEVTKELSEVNITRASEESASAASPASGRCNTCMVTFISPADQRVHYRSDWHRINLKRKMKKLPLAASEIEFQSYPIDHWDVDIVSSST